MIFLINMLIGWLALYILFESIGPLCDMAGGWHCFCHKAKYTLAAVTSAVLITSTLDMANGLFELLVTCTLFLFVWPRFVWRLRNYFDDLDFFNHGN